MLDEGVIAIVLLCALIIFALMVALARGWDDNGRLRQ